MTSPEMATLLGLVLAHLSGDFLFQPHRWVESKQRHKRLSPALYWHACIHGLLTALVLTLAGSGPDIILAGTLLVAISHALIDLGKTYLDSNRLRWFLLDQLLHLLVLLGLWLSWIGSLQPLFEMFAWITTPRALTLAGAYLLVTRPMAIGIALAMRPWSDEVNDPGTLVAAGARIGMLERFLVLTLVLLDELTAVGFLLTAKSVLRFGDLRESSDRKLTEYVLLGTLLSVSATMALGLMVRSLNLG
ncbi:uncharacterized protein DUF3307 [Onishia taeanensis]|uniref:Uncharacterized protein DUF3307 n=1 Tax=Onishia taeanensis TaxID=284577 RepID=A0A328XSX9_9GAMM|nr:DUF3307 domain-containing protein [Halomonas taeanensis]RAR60207.1 uncharacterized protein DUF3307 [Halomonas taeanensis]